MNRGCHSGERRRYARETGWTGKLCSFIQEQVASDTVGLLVVGLNYEAIIGWISP